MYKRQGSDYPDDKEAGVAQIFGWQPGFWTWEAMLIVKNGDLVISHRNPLTEEAMVYANFPYGRTIPIVMHFILSNQQRGVFEIWVDGVLRYQKRNINFGLGSFNNNDVKIGDTSKDFGSDAAGSFTTLKMGQYNYEFDDYDNNETRTVYYDNVSWYNGANGFDIVNPDESSKNLVHMAKRNSSGYAIDGGNNGANRQNVHLWSSNTNNANQKWVEIDRGNGFYSYQKANTNYCIDGGNGGAKGQNVHLWECGVANQNQHWRKVNVGGGNYRLEKRNAPGFSLDGGNGGANRQNLYLWTSSNSNQNQHWRF